MKFNSLIPELCVGNLAASLAFYSLLGFRQEYSRPECKFAFLSLRGCQLMLQQCGRRGKWVSLRKPFGSGVNLQITCRNVSSLASRLGRAKILFLLEENSYRAGKRQLRCRELILHDPDGYCLRFSQQLPSRKPC